MLISGEEEERREGGREERRNGEDGRMDVKRCRRRRMITDCTCVCVCVCVHSRVAGWGIVFLLRFDCFVNPTKTSQLYFSNFSLSHTHTHTYTLYIIFRF